MVSKKNVDEPEEASRPDHVVLSEGASVALGSVFRRLIKPKASERASSKSAGKRPRAQRTPVVLAESEDVKKSLENEKEERRKYKEAKRAKLKFENNALVIPDAATGAALEKELLATATKGAVALFNAVSKAQKVADEKQSGKSKKKGPPVSRESFMDMMRAGVQKGADAKTPNDDAESESTDEADTASAAKWLKPDYLTAGSKKLKDWNKDIPRDGGSSSSSAEDNDSSSEGSEDGDDSD